MKKKKFQKIYGIALAAALIISTLEVSRVYAARAIETNRTDCAIEIDLQDTGVSELNKLSVKVDFYKVAEVSATGAYTVVSEFGKVDLEEVPDFLDLDSETTVADWMEKAAIVKSAVEKVGIEPTVSCETKNGKAVVNNLTVGLYLVDAQQTESDYYIYNFTPYLISLPNNYYSAEGVESVDGWVYDLIGEKALSLKTERIDRYGDLEITKELQVYNETVGGATFVFQIEAFKIDPETDEEKVVYSDVVSMTFKNPGKDCILIEDIPAGAKVIVTEIYSGASYTLESDLEAEVTIEAEEKATVSFTNNYDERLNGGYGIVNHFAYDGEKQEWSWEATEDSTQ